MIMYSKFWSVYCICEGNKYLFKNLKFKIFNCKLYMEISSCYINLYIIYLFKLYKL